MNVGYGPQNVTAPGTSASTIVMPPIISAAKAADYRHPKDVPGDEAIASARKRNEAAPTAVFPGIGTKHANV